MKLVRDRLLSFGILLGVGFLIIVSLVLNALLTLISQHLSGYVPGASEFFLRSFDLAVSLVLSTLLFAMIFKFLPDVRIRWRDTVIGAFVTALLFAIGRVAIGVYLGHSHVATTYGAAAALVIVILWVNYSSVILFIGAEFTEVYARRFGHHIEPEEYAEPVGKGLLRTAPSAVPAGSAPPHPRRRFSDGLSLGRAFSAALALSIAERFFSRHRHRPH
jgi:membrane protein